MSSNPIPDPLLPLRRDQLAPVSPKPRKSVQARVWVFLALAAAGSWVAYELAHRNESRSPAAQTSAIRTAKVTSGSIQRVLRLTGSTNAKNFRSVAAPMLAGPDAGRSLVLIYVASSGGKVKKGDIVINTGSMPMHKRYRTNMLKLTLVD